MKFNKSKVLQSMMTILIVRRKDVSKRFVGGEAVGVYFNGDVEPNRSLMAFEFVYLVSVASENIFKLLPALISHHIDKWYMT